MILQTVSQKLFINQRAERFQAKRPQPCIADPNTVNRLAVLKNDLDPRIEKRYNYKVKPLRSAYAEAVRAMRKYYRHDKKLFKQMNGNMNLNLLREKCHHLAP